MRYAQRLLWLTLMAIAGLAGPSTAQGQEEIVSASATSQDAFRLGPGPATVTRPLVVDATASLTVTVLAASQTLHVTLISPTGTRYAADGSSGAGYDSGILLIDSLVSKPGASYMVTLDTPPAGAWSVEVQEPAVLAAAIDVIRMAMFDNATQMIVVGGGDAYPLGRPVRLAAVVFDHAARVKPLTIAARYFRVGDPAFAPVALTFRDDGIGADEIAGDGIYDAFINAPAAGRYQAQAHASGVASTGSFSRTAAAAFEVVTPRAVIQGFADRGIDHNGDGRLEQVAVAVSGSTTQGGTYDVVVRLRALNGHEIQHSTRKVLGTGLQTIDVLFDTAELASELGVDGPYQVFEARFMFSTATDIVPADIKYDLGPTAAYHIAAFETAPVSLTGVGADAGIDTNGNGQFDQLKIDIEVNVRSAATYNVTVSLRDKYGAEIGFLAGTRSLTAGSNTVTFVFPGSPIGLNRVDGPYELSNLLIYGGGNSLVQRLAFTTRAFAATAFEGVPPVGVPAGFAAGVSGNEVTFTWGAGPGLQATDGYRLEAGIGPGTTVAVIDMGNVTTYTVSDAPDGVFYVRLRGRAGPNFGTASGEIQVRIGAAALPGTPVGFLANATDNTVAMAWMAPASGGARGFYRVNAALSPGGPPVAVLPAGDEETMLWVEGAPPGTYYLRVVAVGPAGTSPPSNEVAVTVPGACTVAAAPRNLRRIGSGNTVRLNWDLPATGAAPTGFVLEAGFSPGASNAAVVPTGAMSLVTGAPNGTYYVRIRATNPCGSGPSTADLTVVVP